MNFVTGASGIVGSHLLVDLLKENKPVRALERKTSGREAVQRLLRFHDMTTSEHLIEWVEGDINDPVSLLEATQGCTRVYHCAALVSFSRADSDRLFMTNTEGTGHVVNACLVNGIPEIVYISSTAAIGDELIDDQQHEHSAWTTDKGRSDYSLSKRYAEMTVWRGVQEGLKAIIVNPGLVIGPGKWGQSSTTMITSCDNGMRFYPTGSNGFVDARDIVKAIHFLEKGNHWNDRFLLIGESLSFKGFFEKVCGMLGTAMPSVALSKDLVRPVRKVIQVFEFLGFNRFQLTSESLKSAYRKVNYSSQKIENLGFRFTPMDEAISYTLKVRSLG